MHRDELARVLDGWLQPELFRDVAENGLQVAGKDEVKRVVCGVSANLDLIDAAIEKKADAIFVHHGIVWGGGIRRLTGWLGERVRKMMAEGISLYAYHLPLDAHPRLGNNAGLADALGLDDEREPFGTYKGQKIGCKGELSPLSVDELVARAQENVGGPLAVFGDRSRPVKSLGLCTGGAPDLLYEAIDEGLDAFVTGEVTEWCKAVAEESGTRFFALGHHNTERFGARRMAHHMARELDLDASFVDVENPA